MNATWSSGFGGAEENHNEAARRADFGSDKPCRPRSTEQVGSPASRRSVSR
jgi:hypothetical protein